MACNFIKKESMAQVFSCEFCEISTNTFFTEHLWAIASEKLLSNVLLFSCWTDNNVYSWFYFQIVTKNSQDLALL